LKFWAAAVKGGPDAVLSITTSRLNPETVIGKFPAAKAEEAPAAMKQATAGAKYWGSAFMLFFGVETIEPEGSARELDSERVAKHIHYCFQFRMTLPDWPESMTSKPF
jgi:hypothetical protein